MKTLLDLIPLIIFFIFYKTYDIFVASGALIFSSLFVLALVWIKYRKIETMMLVSTIIVVVLSSMTLIFHSDIFIKWKVTIIYFLFSAALLVGQWIFKKTLIQRVLGKELSLPDHIWSRMNLYWALFFLICGITNIYIAFWFPLSIWVNFKVFGLTAATFLFTLLTVGYIYRHLAQTDKKK